MTPQQDFLRREFRTLSFMGATQHVPIYAESADEEARKAFRMGLYARLELFAQAYAHAEIGEDEHIANVQRFADELSNEFASTLKDGRFLVGPAQKALNLYLKYLWCAGWTHRPPHCPVDSIVLAEAGNTSIRWSQLALVEKYREAIDVLRAAATKAGFASLAEWELSAWRNGKARAAGGVSPDKLSCHAAAPQSAKSSSRTPRFILPS